MRTLQKLGSVTALVVLASMLTLAAGQQVPTFTAEQRARLQIREVMDGLYVIPGFDGGRGRGRTYALGWTASGGKAYLAAETGHRTTFRSP